MKQRVVQMPLLGLIMALCHVLREVRSVDDVYGQAEPSHHVMHIRKLSDSDRLKIELEPVWFHLESTEQKLMGESQQVKRQAKETATRPVPIFSSLKQLERHRRKNRPDSESAVGERENSESYFKDFWHADERDDQYNSREMALKSSSLKQQLEDVDVPKCFRRYLHELYDRNNESVRKLMRCLGQHSEESCQEARRLQRVQPYRGRENRANDPQQGLYERKVIRRRKYSDDRDLKPATDKSGETEREDLRFEKLFIRSDNDDPGQVFTTSTDESSSAEDGSNETHPSGEVNDARNSSQESEEPARPKEQYDPREPYRRPKYNTEKTRRGSEESSQDCSCEGSESCEHC